MTRFLVLALLTLPALAQSVTGRVVDGSQHSVPNLQVKLRPPETSKAPVQIGVTDQSGAFTFRSVMAGRYLLEVSQGPYVLYRAPVTAPTANLTVSIQRR